MQDDKILSIRVFGSVARKENNEGSDLDILIVSEKNEFIPEIIKESFQQHKNVEFSTYSRSRLEEMFNEGHLFAWHLYLESIPAENDPGNNWFSELGAPNPYKEANIDLTQFLLILDESTDAINTDSDYIFEAGMIYLCLRNIGMILSYLDAGLPNFSKYSALELPLKIRPSISKESYDFLILCRRISARGNTSDAPTKNIIFSIFAEIKNWSITIKEQFPCRDLKDSGIE
ncbi:nucleotidyltransferase family protein [Janthinobacterium sp. NFX145]|uniref:nucleotidyltransferase family protein n=1 Tax=Janthinobacterium sp. NFX145 TaxID=3415602 RepID=UPI003CC664F8